MTRHARRTRVRTEHGHVMVLTGKSAYLDFGTPAGQSLEERLDPQGLWSILPSGARDQLERLGEAYSASLGFMLTVENIVGALRGHAQFREAIEAVAGILTVRATRSPYALLAMEEICAGVRKPRVADSLATDLLNRLLTAEALDTRLVRDTATLVGGNTFQSCTAEQQTAMLDLFFALGHEARTAFAALSITRAHTYGKWHETFCALQSQDLRSSGAQSLLDHLTAFVQSGSIASAHDRGGLTDEQIKTAFLSDLLQELARPGVEIDQGDQATCTATCMLHRLALFSPAEYARLAIDVLARGGAHLADGRQVACADSRYSAPVPLVGGDRRSISERLTQSMLIVGMEQRWDPSGGRGTTASADTIARMLGSVFGRPYRPVMRSPMPGRREDVAPAPAELQEFYVRLHAAPVFATVIFGFSEGGGTERHLVDFVWFARRFAPSFRGRLARLNPPDPQALFWLWNPWPREPPAPPEGDAPPPGEPDDDETSTETATQGWLPQLHPAAHHRAYNGISVDDLHRYWHTYWLPT